MYAIIYNLDRKHWEEYNFHFSSIWAATFKARAICTEHWADVDVIDRNTGVVLVSFNRVGEAYVDEELSEDIKKLASLPIE